MPFAKTSPAGKLWWDALRSRWSLRRAAGESRWQLMMHTVRWLHLFSRQNRWLRALDARRTTQQAAQADPRLYERWHHPYISSRFDVDTRRQIVSAHYHFLMQRFPVPLCERIVRGHGVRLASLWLEDASRVYVHLGKPTRADAGELSLSLLTQDKELLASCTLTFDRPNSLLVGAMHGPGRHTPLAASSAFIHGSDGLHPEDLLLALVQTMAETLEVKRVRAVSSSVAIVRSTHGAGDDGNDAFWQTHGAVLADGYLALPLSPMVVAHAEDATDRAKRQRRESFREQACEALAIALGKKAPLPRDSTRQGAPNPASIEHGRSLKLANALPAPDGLLAASL